MTCYRKAEADDISEVKELAIELCQELPITHRNPEYIRAHIEQAWSAGILQVFVAVEDKRIVGIIAFIVGPEPWSGRPTGYEAFWYVKPECRGGVGIKLLEYVEKNLKCDILDLGVYNPRLLKLLERRGYKQVKAVITKEL